MALLVFIERYATDLLKWDILTFFAHNPDLWASATETGQQIGWMTRSVCPELGDLALLGILEQRWTQTDVPLYRLTQDAEVRRVIFKFAHQLTPYLLS